MLSSVSLFFHWYGNDFQSHGNIDIFIWVIPSVHKPLVATGIKALIIPNLILSVHRHKILFFNCDAQHKTSNRVWQHSFGVESLNLNCYVLFMHVFYCFLNTGICNPFQYSRGNICKQNMATEARLIATKVLTRLRFGENFNASNGVPVVLFGEARDGHAGTEECDVIKICKYHTHTCSRKKCYSWFQREKHGN